MGKAFVKACKYPWSSVSCPRDYLSNPTNPSGLTPGWFFQQQLKSITIVVTLGALTAASSTFG
jgi:hypothetical protein